MTNSISEHETRKKYIDKALKKEGWIETYIKEEVNPVKSDFNNKIFVLFDGNIEKNVDLFIDYLLLDENKNPLAIIEAKRYSKDPETGRVQARTYAKEIESKIDDKIPIFLTNGQKWIFIDEYGVEREVSGVFSQKDLKRRRDLFNNCKNPATMKINPSIVDRPRSVQIVRSVSEYFSQCHRTALIQMATGTGKTRVAMAVIDVLMKSNLVRNVLFIADRTSLVRQAKVNGFTKFFDEPVGDLREGFTENKRLYVSTIQTLMSGNANEPKFYEKFSPGFFDLIIFDEAHRSIYDKNNLVFQYFDAIKIGLTATPKESETKSTFDLFGEAIEDYSYDKAINDGILVPYKAHSIYTDVLNEGIDSKDLDEFTKDELRRQGINPDDLELTGSQFDSVFMDNYVNDLVIETFMNNAYKSDEGKPAKSIFFCSSKKHAKAMKERFNSLYPHLSSDVQVITSDLSRADDEIDRFKLDSEPRIVLSVGMLDTGVDIPEVCNLVFIKPVYSSIRFWQMIGRGTRNEESCKHKEWLPNQKKEDFLIFDFVIGGHSNIDFHEFREEGKLKENVSTITAIFNNRVSLLEENLTENQRKIITAKLYNTLNQFRDDLWVVNKKKGILDRLRNTEDLENHIAELTTEISPLTTVLEGYNPNVSKFIQEAEKLFACILHNDLDRIGKIKSSIQYKVRNVLEKDNITVIKEKQDDLKKVLQISFWEDLTFERVEFLVNEISSTMVYFVADRKGIIYVSVPDQIIDWVERDKEIAEDEELKRLLERNEAIKKLKEGKGITSKELLYIEKELSSLRPELTIDLIQRSRGTDFLVFLREIIGLTREEDPKQLIEQRFDELILSDYSLNNGVEFNSNQIEFLILLKKVFANRKHIELQDFAEEPLDKGKNFFEFDSLNRIVEMCNQIKMC